MAVFSEAEANGSLQGSCNEIGDEGGMMAVVTPALPA